MEGGLKIDAIAWLLAAVGHFKHTAALVNRQKGMDMLAKHLYKVVLLARWNSTDFKSFWKPGGQYLLLCIF